MHRVYAAPHPSTTLKGVERLCDYVARICKAKENTRLRASGSGQTTRVALSKRALLTGVLHALASDPPKVIARVCRQLSLCVLAPEAGAILPLPVSHLFCRDPPDTRRARYDTYVHSLLLHQCPTY